MTSAVAGYLTPVITTQEYDNAFDDFFHGVIVGVTALDKNLVRPRWQEDPPTLPQRTVTWVGFGVVGDAVPDTFAYEAVDKIVRHEVATVLCTFYGPLANTYAALLRDGLALSQNRWELDRENIGLIEAIGPRTFAESIKDTWVRRADLSIRLRREVGRKYEILSLLSAHGIVHTDAEPLDFEFGTGGNVLVPQLDYSKPDGAVYAMAVGV